jgi:uncharacterized protein YggE
MEKPDTITVTVAHREDINADKTDIHVTIKGSSLVTGNAALKKAKEVSQLVAGLAEVGVKEHDIALEGIHAESSSGVLGRATSAIYELRVRCHDLEQLAEILGVITAQKNAKLSDLSWRYPDDKKLKAEWVRTCLAEAREKAGCIASGLGVKLLGVHSLSEKWMDSEEGERPHHLREMLTKGAAFMARRATPVELGFPLAHSKWMEIEIVVQFRVSEFDAA